MKRIIQNRAKSIRAKLLNIKNSTGHEYMYLLSRYFNERLLYRLSVSKYRNNFVLKGGAMLYALDGLDARPTVDVDFMANKISRDANNLENVFREILSISCELDAVIFDTVNLHSEPITIDNEYPGIRIFVMGKMDTIEHNLTIDIGFGDVVTPHTQTMDFPLLLPDNPAITLNTYSIETVLAEKFHTMIERDVANSRMKDFFDCYMILKSNIIIDPSILQMAVYATFDNRGLRYNKNLQLFSPSFSSDKMRLIRWRTFLKKIKWHKELSFEEVMSVIQESLYPIYDYYWKRMESDDK